MSPWLTEADLAELDIACWELVTVLENHREGCALCREDARARRENDRYRLPLETWPCPVPGRTIDLVLEWWERRNLLSRAQFYRALQSRREAA